MSQIKVDSIVPSGGLPAGSDGGGIIQIKQVSTNSDITSTNNVPRDNTVPTSSEGVQLLSTTFACRTTSSRVLITVCVYGNENTNQGDNITYCVYKGTTFIGMGFQQVTGSGGDQENHNHVSFDILHSPASTSSLTYSLRAGVNGGTYEHLSTTTYSQNSHYGSNKQTTMTIYEISG